MSIAVELPALGESVVEGTISRWLVKEGDRVARDQPIVEVTTDKVDAEIPAPATGTVVRILAAEGETVPVGAPLATIEPPWTPAPGPMSITWSDARIVASSCSTTMTLFPMSRSRHRLSINR